MLLKGTYADANHLVGANFLLILFGSAMITINAKLVGVKYSFFFYICVLGSLTRLFASSLPGSRPRQSLCRKNHRPHRSHGSVRIRLFVGNQVGLDLLFTDAQADPQVYGPLPGVLVLPVLRLVHHP